VHGITRKNLQNKIFKKIRKIEYDFVVSMVIVRWQTCFQIDAFVGIYQTNKHETVGRDMP
jgi:hypothetical protein